MMRAMASKASLFRQKFLNAKVPLRIVGAHDGLGAQLIEKYGFDGVWASGLEISASHGVPDANILTMTQYLERAQEMTMASTLPVIADVDTGYGNSSNVAYMVEQYEGAGIAAVVMEDKLFPKVNSFVPGRQELAAIPEFCGKIAAAQDAKRSDDFLVIARVEALIAGWGLEEALRRSEAYVDAGADGILIHSKSKEPEEIRAFLKAWKRRSPIVLVPTTYPAMTYEEMKRAGVNMIIYANQGMRAAIAGMHQAFDVIARKKSTVSIEGAIAPVKEIFELQGMMKLKEHEKKYLRTQKTVHAIIPAAGAPQDKTMMRVLRGKPVVMLNTEGKPLLQRIVESLNLAGIQDVTVIAGHGASAVKGDLIVKKVSKDFASTGLLHSIEQAADKLRDSVLIHFGDVIVSHENLRAFTACEEPIVALVSPLLGQREREKALDYVSLARPRKSATRALEPHPRNRLRRIGKNIPHKDAHGEFVGLLLLNPAGVRIWKETVKRLPPKLARTCSLNDVLQKIVDGGTDVTTFETQTGWAEVHSVEDYERLCALLRDDR